MIVPGSNIPLNEQGFGSFRIIRPLLAYPRMYNGSICELPNGNAFAFRAEKDDGECDVIICLPGKEPFVINPGKTDRGIVKSNIEDPRLRIREGLLEMNYTEWDWTSKSPYPCRVPVASIDPAQATSPLTRMFHERLQKGQRIPSEVLQGQYRGADAGRAEKNWVFFEDSTGTDNLIYYPHVICRKIDGKSIEVNSRKFEWAFGQWRCGCVVKLDTEKWLHFIHSSTLHNGVRIYYVGAYIFLDKWPYKVVSWTPEPLFWGTSTEENFNPNHRVVFPCGAILKDGKITISLGVNDMVSAVCEVGLDELLKRME